MAPYAHLVVLCKFMGELDTITFDHHIHIQILLLQKEIPDKTSNQICVISQHVCNNSKIFEKPYELPGQAFLEHGGHTLLSLKVGGMLCVVKKVRYYGSSHQDIHEIRPCNHAHNPLILHHREDSQFVFYDQILYLPEGGFRAYRGELYVHIFLHLDVTEAKKYGLLHNLPSYISNQLILTIDDNKDIDIVFGHDGGSPFYGLIGRDMNGG